MLKPGSSSSDSLSDIGCCTSLPHVGDAGFYDTPIWTLAQVPLLYLGFQSKFQSGGGKSDPGVAQITSASDTLSVQPGNSLCLST
jgi:hypothetical protein